MKQGADVAQDLQAPTTRDADGATAELGQLMLRLMAEQTMQAVQLGVAVSRAVSWHEIAQAQGDFLKASLERGSRIGRWQMRASGA